MKGERRTLREGYLARVEGEGSLLVRLRGQRAAEVVLSIFEPPRFFEALLRGRAFSEAPDITSRICGICPVAYLMSACQAMEDALGARVSEPIQALRRLLFCGEWIGSHGLHVFLLHAPDFLGYPDAVAMAADHRDWVERGLRIKRAGNAIMELLGGREIHPINVRVGGFYSAPSRAQLAALLPELRWARQATEACLEWAASFSFPELERDYELVALRHPRDYPFCEGRIVSSSGLDIDVADFEQHFAEEQVPGSTALRSQLRGRGNCLCGPMARFALCFDQLHPEVQQLALDIGLRPPCRNPYQSILVRLVEIAQCFTEAIRIIESYQEPEAPHIELRPRAATGMGATEAPRGLLYHRYQLDPEGSIEAAQIVPPTVQNLPTIEEDIRAMAAELAAAPRDRAQLLAEQAVRNHDPCISCATHFLRLDIEEA